MRTENQGHSRKPRGSSRTRENCQTRTIVSKFGGTSQIHDGYGKVLSEGERIRWGGLEVSFERNPCMTSKIFKNAEKRRLH